jgi:membrane-associated phospholipid phosphatase
MRVFVICAVAHALAAAVAVWLLSGDPLLAVGAAINGTLATARAIALAAPLAAVPVAIALVLILLSASARARLPLVLAAVLGTIALQIGFSTFKNLIPVLVPYYADPPLAAADRWLHLGVDPWLPVHRIAAFLPMESLLVAYLQLWVLPAMLLPVLAAATDPDAARRTRLLWVYLGIWILLGNLAAVAGSSVGPVFHDRLLGTDRFADLAAAIAASPLPQSLIGGLDAYLWGRYQSGQLIFGLGISAFPSVHVAIATLTALYLGERNRWLGLAGWLFAVLILFLSVYTGLHYALDGYASVLVVVAGWRGLKRLQRPAIA